jgi:hypothetical protein
VATFTSVSLTSLPLADGDLALVVGDLGLGGDLHLCITNLIALDLG